MKKQTGFTLIELLVSTAIMLLLLLVLSATSIGITNMWQRGIAHNERREEVIFVFQKITKDLRTAAASINPFNAPVFLINPSKVGITYTNPQALFFEGGPKLYGYFVQWINNTPSLCRLQVNRGIAINDQLILDNAPLTKESGYKGLLAENILGLWVQPLDGNVEPIAATTTGSWNANNGYKVELEDWRLVETEKDDPDDHSIPPRKIKVFINVFQGIKNYSFKMPATVKIAIVVVDKRRAKLLTDAEKPPRLISGNAMNDAVTFFTGLREPIRRGANIYITTVFLPTGPK